MDAADPARAREASRARVTVLLHAARQRFADPHRVHEFLFTERDDLFGLCPAAAAWHRPGGLWLALHLLDEVSEAG